MYILHSSRSVVLSLSDLIRFGFFVFISSLFGEAIAADAITSMTSWSKFKKTVFVETKEFYYWKISLNAINPLTISY